MGANIDEAQDFQFRAGEQPPVGERTAAFKAARGEHETQTTGKYGGRTMVADIDEAHDFQYGALHPEKKV